MRYFGTLLCAVAALVLASAAPAAAEVLVGLGTPLTGPYAWGGAATKEGVAVAVADLNAGGGVLGEPIAVLEADDYCDGEQAVAAANKLMAAGVVEVFGHQCSGAAIPASKVYAAAGIPMIATAATNPGVTGEKWGQREMGSGLFSRRNRGWTRPRLLLMTILVCGLAARSPVRLQWPSERAPS